MVTAFTLDTNCIIDLEEGRMAATYIQELLSHHDASRINLRVVGISASERTGSGEYISNFGEFKQKLERTGLAKLDVLIPIAYWGVTFWDWGLMADERMIDLERQIHEILFPEIEFLYADYCQRNGIQSVGDHVDPKWRNAKCDVLGLWSHIHHGGGIFVTSDNDFHKATKKPLLIALGAGDILRPADAAARLVRGQLTKRLSNSDRSGFSKHTGRNGYPGRPWRS